MHTAGPFLTNHLQEADMLQRMHTAVRSLLSFAAPLGAHISFIRLITPA
jgi:hypothetical protein